MSRFHRSWRVAVGMMAAIASLVIGLPAASATTSEWDALTDQEKQSSYGFFIWKSENAKTQDEKDAAAKAANLLKTAKYASYTHIGQSQDATALSNFKTALEEVIANNAFRFSKDDEPCRTDLESGKGRVCDDASKKLTPLTVSDQSMAMAQSDANFSQYKQQQENSMQHAKQFSVAEVMAWPYEWRYSGEFCWNSAGCSTWKVGDPGAVSQWYEEKVAYDKQQGVEPSDPDYKTEIGHYTNITNKYPNTGSAATYYEYTLTGIGLSGDVSGYPNSQPGFKTTEAQIFSNDGLAQSYGYSGPTADAQHYLNEVNDYIKKVNPAKITKLTVNPSSVTVDANQNATTVDLSNVTVTATYDDGTSGAANVQWTALTANQLATLHSTQGGNFDVTGTVSGSFATGVNNTVTVKVKVNPASVTKVVIKGSDSAEAEVTTASGTAPQLPTKATVTWSNGKTADETIIWPTINKNQYSNRNGGSFNVTATVQGRTLTAHVTVAKATVTAVDSPQAVTTVKQVKPQLPSTVKVHWSNGDTTDEPVTWNTIDPDQYAQVNNQGFTVNGTVTVQGNSKIVAITVKVVDAQITKVNTTKLTATVESGAKNVANSLPASTEVTYSNQTTGNAPITWTALTAEQQATVANRKGGSFTVNGTVNGNFADGVSKAVTVTVTVNPATVSKVTLDGTNASASVTVDSGTSVEGLKSKLPQTAKVAWSNGDTTDEAITWSNLTAAQQSTLNSIQGGTFSLTATMQGQTLTANVTVKAATVQSVAKLDPVTTPAKQRPTLPSEVKVTWSNGATTDEVIAWTLNESDYATRGAKTIKGTILNGSHEVSVQLTVTATITKVANPAEVTVNSGIDPTPKFATTVTVTYSDDSTEQKAVTWETVSRSQYAKREGGTFTVNGTVEGTTIKAVQTVKVNAATISSVAAQTPITVIAGAAKPKLPATVEATYSNGDKNVPVEVTWNDSAVKYDVPGTYTAIGTVRGWSKPVNLTVTVEQATITSLTNPADQTVSAFKFDAKPTTADLELPGKVQATLSNGKTSDVVVTWASLSADQAKTLTSRKGGSFTLTGTVAGTDKTVTVKVTVQAATVTTAKVANPTVTTNSGTAPKLPAKATVTWSNGETAEETITWSAIDKAQYSNRAGGSFEVTGTVEGQVVKATVNVNPATPVDLVKQEINVTTTVGKAPQLPATVQVRWSNGDVTNEPVTWETPDAQQYAKQGSFTVDGVVTVAAPKAVTRAVTTFTVKAKVTVTEKQSPVPPAQHPDTDDQQHGQNKPSNQPDNGDGQIQASQNDQNGQNAQVNAQSKSNSQLSATGTTVSAIALVALLLLTLGGVAVVLRRRA